VIANQKKLGIVAENVQLPARNPFIKPWDSLSSNEKNCIRDTLKLMPAF
jgi:hypothetical protein